jgi:hypothetical protein
VKRLFAFQLLFEIVDDGGHGGALGALVGSVARDSRSESRESRRLASDGRAS